MSFVCILVGIGMSISAMAHPAISVAYDSEGVAGLSGGGDDSNNNGHVPLYHVAFFYSRVTCNQGLSVTKSAFCHNVPHMGVDLASVTQCDYGVNFIVMRATFLASVLLAVVAGLLAGSMMVSACRQEGAAAGRSVGDEDEDETTTSCRTSSVATTLALPVWCGWCCP
jgi:hypothetical protein